MHRAHEELCRMAMERLDADGLIVHMLLGKLKLGDLPAEVRDDCIRIMVDHYFPENSVMVSGYGFDMLYAGPREALLHAIFRQNMGATHLIVGRDHAGVGDFYGPFDAQAEESIVRPRVHLQPLMIAWKCPRKRPTSTASQVLVAQVKHRCLLGGAWRAGAVRAAKCVGTMQL